MSNFVHLHVHTEYSMLDGGNRISDLVTHVKKLGQQAIAITDHGVMHGAVDFLKECKKQGIKPIIGCEVYVAPRTRFDKQHGIDTSPYHLVLLCKNETGYQNLIKMVSAGFIEGFYSRPRIDRDLLEQYSEGLIALSGCLAGEIPRLLNSGMYDKAKETALYYKNLFGKDNYYIEIQNHGIPDQIKILPLMQKLAEETSVGLVATNDSHYLTKEDSKVQKVLVAIATNRTIYDENSMEFQTEEFYIKSKEEMEDLFGQFTGAIENTNKIADMCNFEFEFGNTKLPLFENPTNENNYQYLKKMSYEGLHKNYTQSPSQDVIDRLEYELDVIFSMGYVDYFLIVHDFIMYAKSKDIPVGPGRGSGAGSIVAYCTGITGVDPIKYNLLFERFLNPERISMPDFDIDFDYVRRQEVIDYVVEKYGSDHVAQIITFGTMAARGSLRDVGRALGMSYASVDVVAKAVPFELGMTLDLALESSADFRKLYNNNEANKELIDTARKVEGMVRHASTHAAGVVITDKTADSYVPLQKNDESIVTQYPMNNLEELGLLKMDFLGLRNLTVIKEVETIVSARGERFSIGDILLDDKAVFALFAKGQTNGVFQFESGGMKNVLMQLKPEHMEDIIAVISLYRPGPMDSIPTYVKNRHNPQLITYKHELLKSILDVTYGVIVYQEQVMEICRKLAGYSLGRADLVRRAMSKKDHEIMKKERNNFIYGAKKEDGTTECVGAVYNGVSEQIANQIFDEMNAFASYAFNKSHAAAYALISYQTAYLKCHYPSEYMAALMTSVLDNTIKVTDYITEAQSMNIRVLPPTINQSNANFTVVDKDIRFGLLAVKNIGKGFIENLVEERKENGAFTNLMNLLERMHGKGINKRIVEGLIKCGSLDEFKHNRRQMLMGFESILDNLEKEYRNNISGQIDFFGGEDSSAEMHYLLPDVDDFTLTYKLAMEKESCGLYLSGHPLDDYKDHIKKLKGDNISSFYSKKVPDNSFVKIIAIVNKISTKITKNNDTMAFVDLEDKTGVIECLVFPKSYGEYSTLLLENNILYITARLKAAPDEDPTLVCDSIEKIENIKLDKMLKLDTAKSSNKTGVYLKLPYEDCFEQGKISDILSQSPGREIVYFYFMDSKKYLRTPKKMWVNLNNDLENQLKKILGEKNVAVIK